MPNAIKTAVKKAAIWAYAHRTPLSILVIQYTAIVISVLNRQNEDFVLWIWGLVAFLVGAITSFTKKFDSGFWFFVQLVFGGLLAITGYFYLP